MDQLEKQIEHIMAWSRDSFTQYRQFLQNQNLILKTWVMFSSDRDFHIDFMLGIRSVQKYLAYQLYTTAF